MKPLFAGIIAFTLIATLFAPAAAHFDKRSADQPSILSAIALSATVHQVDIKTSGFDPEEITIPEGDSINWTNQTSETVSLEEGMAYTIYLPLVLKSYSGTSAPVPANTASLSADGISILPAGSYTRAFPTVGTYHFYLQGHPSYQFLLTVQAQPDLEVRTITLNPNPAVKDSPVSLATDIYNLGTGDAGAFSVSWKLIPLGQTTPVDSGSWDVNGLSAGGHTSLNATFTALQPGPFTLQVTADPSSALPDADPSNNTKAVEFGVSGTINFCATISSDTTWAYATYVLTCSIDVNSGATLTVAPGTIVKFQGVLSIIVSGALSVPGTSDHPVFFSSYLDDTIGGDTNNDGSATSPAPMDWNSIIVSSSGTASLSYANIRFGGYHWCGVSCYGNSTPLSVSDGGSAVLDHVSMAHSGGYGIYVYPSSDSHLSVTHSTIETSELNGIRVDGIAGKNITITNNTFTRNGSAAVSLAFSGGSVTTLDGNTGSGNGVNGIQLSGTLGMDTTLPGNPGFAYEISGGLTVNNAKTLTLSPGAVVKFGSAGETLTVNGSLTANGTEAFPVTFTSLLDDTAGGDTNNDGSATSPAPMDWNSIVVAPGETAILTHANIRYGGYHWCGVSCYGNSTPLRLYSGASALLEHVAMAHNGGYGIYVDPSSTSHLSVSHSTIETSELDGIRVDGIAGKNITITNNTFTGNGAAAVSLAFSGGSVTALDGNSGSGNPINGIQLSGTLGMDATLPGNPAFAYVVNGGLAVDSGKTLTLSPDAVVKLGSAGETLTVAGSLIANGTEASPVTFTSFKDDAAGGDTNNDAGASSPAPMDWNSIAVAPGGTAALTHANIRYGGFHWCGVVCYGNSTPLSVSDGGSAVLDHVSMAHSGGYGIYVNPSRSSQLSVTHSTIETSELNGIRVDGIAGKNITITNNTFTGNGSAAVSLAFSGGSVTTLDGNTGSGNGVNGIQLSGTLGMDTTLPGNPGFAYEISGGLTVDNAKTLTLSPGAVVKFGSAGETLTVNGSLIANGTEAFPVTFTSLLDDVAGGDTNNDAGASSPARGDWNSIIVAPGGTAALTHATILYGGFHWCGVVCYGNNVALWLQGSASASLHHTVIRESNGLAISAGGNSETTSLTIEDSSIEDNNSTGIDIANSGTYTLSISRTIIRNNATGINLSGSSISATVNHCNIYSNSGLGINNATPSIVDAAQNWWGDASGPAPYGSGNGVSGTLTVTPWLTTPEDLP
jgi:plastocyanin